MFNFLEASLTPDADADFVARYEADVAADLPATASSLEVRISTDTEIQKLRECTSASA